MSDDEPKQHLEPLVADSTPAKYTEEQRELALTTLARFNGNATRASKALGGYPERQTLRKWKKLHHARYLELQQEVIPQIRAAQAERAAELARKEATVEEEALALLRDNLVKLDPRDLGGALRNVATSKGINLTHMDKLQAPPERPADNANNLVEAIAKLERMGVITVAGKEPDVQVPDAEIVEEPDER